MEKTSPRICIVDDDEAVRDSLRMLLRSAGLPAETFASGEEFLAAWTPDWHGCLILDVRMPGLSGMEVQKQLIERQASLAIVFVTGHGDIPMAVEALHLGAFDFVQKPFTEEEILDRVRRALEADQEREALRAARQAVEDRHASLTSREREVMASVIRGHANKVIGFDLNLSQRTVEIHRARVMEKMQARSLADLVRMGMLLEAREARETR